MSEWIENIADLSRGGYMVLDAMGVHVENVVRARETPEGVAVVFLATGTDGTELVGSTDGVTMEPIEAQMIIPGGMLERIDEG